MNKKKENSILRILRYDGARKYFGEMTGHELNMAYKIFKHTQDWEKPVVNARVRVGRIDSSIICNALWHEMSYNPVRFGNISPFLNRGDAIYRFCDKELPTTTPGYNVLVRVQKNLRDFMALNHDSNNGWNDVISPKDGYVVVKFVNDHSDDNYKMLATLRATMRIITEQNEQDFARPEYRGEMLRVILARHPNGVRGTRPIAQSMAETYIAPQPLSPDEEREDRLDQAMDNAQITAENEKYFSAEQSVQAVNDMKQYAIMGAKEHTK